jgi:hypothetical protein
VRERRQATGRNGIRGRACSCALPLAAVRYFRRSRHGGSAARRARPPPVYGGRRLCGSGLIGLGTSQCRAEQPRRAADAGLARERQGRASTGPLVCNARPEGNHERKYPELQMLSTGLTRAEQESDPSLTDGPEKRRIEAAHAASVLVTSIPPKRPGWIYSCRLIDRNNGRHVRGRTARSIPVRLEPALPTRPEF